MFFSAAVLALPFLAQSVLAGSCTRKYTIQQGDICDGISDSQHVSTFQLAAVNPHIIDATCSNLVPNTEICIGYAGEDCTSTYTVVADDTCELVAAKYGFNTTILALNNPQLDEDCSNLYIGEVLCVSGSVQVPPVPAAGFVPGAAIPTTAAPARPTGTKYYGTKAYHGTKALRPTPAPQPNAPAPASPDAPAAPAPAVSAPAAPAPAAPAPAAPAPDAPADDEDLPYCDEIDY